LHIAKLIISDRANFNADHQLIMVGTFNSLNVLH